MSEAELTIIILTRNEAAHIVACIESVAWADRVVVFDSESDDGTPMLARAAGAEVGGARFANYADQRNKALAFVQTDWVFFVDADERGTPQLGEEIRAVIAVRPEQGWYVPRHNYIFGKLTLGAGWWPDYQLRLFRHGKVQYERPVHEQAVVDGAIGHLQNPLIHYNYRDVAHFHAKQRPYSDTEARILFEQGVTAKWHTPLTMPLRQFWWRFITLRGFCDGRHGAHLAALLAYYEWRKYRRLAALRANSAA